MTKYVLLIVHPTLSSVMTLVRFLPDADLRIQLKNLDPDSDPRDPKIPDPDPPYTIFNKPYYVWDVLTSFLHLMTQINK